MRLSESTKKYNKSLSDRICSIKLKDLITSEEGSHDYTLFDFINMFKIKRLSECGLINETTERELMSVLNKYRNKAREMSKLPVDEPTTAIRMDLINKAENELINARNILMKYGVDPNPNNALGIGIEDIVDYDIERNSYYDGYHPTTKIVDGNTMDILNKQLVTKIFKLELTGTNDSDVKSNIDLYNKIKLDHLVQQKYIPKEYKDVIINSIETGDSSNQDELKKELSEGPCYLIFDEFRIDLSAFVDFLNHRDARKLFKDDVIYENKLSGSTR